MEITEYFFNECKLGWLNNATPDWSVNTVNPPTPGLLDTIMVRWAKNLEFCWSKILNKWISNGIVCNFSQKSVISMVCVFFGQVMAIHCQCTVWPAFAGVHRIIFRWTPGECNGKFGRICPCSTSTEYAGNDTSPAKVPSDWTSAHSYCWLLGQFA